MRTHGMVTRTRPQVVLGTKKKLPAQPIAPRKLDESLSRINDRAYQATRVATIAEFAIHWREEVLAKRNLSTVCSANCHLNSQIIPQLGKPRLDQIRPENQQIFVNHLVGASGKTVLNVLSALFSMLTIAKNLGYSCKEIDVRKLVPLERNTHAAFHFAGSQVESIFTLSKEPWRTFFILLTMAGCTRGRRLGYSGETLTSIIRAFTSAAPRGTGELNPQRAREARRPSVCPRRSQRF